MKPFFILPFDHRAALTHEIFNAAYPPTPIIAKKMSALKKIIWDGFLLGYKEVKDFGDCGILLDDEYGSAILDDAKKRGITHILSTEKSGATGFSFIHGKGFGRAIIKRDPTFAKALVNYTIGDTELNNDNQEKLHELSHFCIEEGVPLMLEPLFHGKKSALIMATIGMQDMQRHGIRPTVWKIEPMPTQKDWKKLAKIAQAPMIVLGRNAPIKEVDEWIKTAASSGVVDGFAVGRTVFFDALKKYIAKTITRKEAVALIAKNYVHYAKLWKKYQTN